MDSDSETYQSESDFFYPDKGNVLQEKKNQMSGHPLPENIRTGSTTIAVAF